MSYLSIAVSVLGVLVAVYRQFWSDSAQLKSLELKLAELRARQATERERLQATYGRIRKEPDQHGQTLADALNKSNEGLRR